MPLLLLLLVLLAVPAIIAITLPIAMVVRYRAGTSRQRARPWLAFMNLAGLGVSTLFFFVSAGISSFWVPGALGYSAVGLGGGVVLGIAGLRLTRWEVNAQTLHYVPNRWLVLAITVGVLVRLAFGFWRMWHAWHASGGEQSWVAASGLAGSMASGAVLLGYYLAFSFGVWWLARSVSAVPSR